MAKRRVRAKSGRMTIEGFVNRTKRSVEGNVSGIFRFKSSCLRTVENFNLQKKDFSRKIFSFTRNRIYTLWENGLLNEVYRNIEKTFEV